MKVLNQVEEWQPITGYEGLYEISNLGRVKTQVVESDLAKKHFCGLKNISPRTYRRYKKCFQ